METLNETQIQDDKISKQLYLYQQGAIDQIFDRLAHHPESYNLLYQLPTGGGKTIIFSEIAKRFIKNTGKKVLILTHRIELCGQTSQMLKEIGVKNKIINSLVKNLPEPNEYMCFVAMVETLNNRLNDDSLNIDNVGLVIIDEAHYNSFLKLFKFFEKSVILGVTATPLSSNIKLPMKDTYDELIIGESIGSLINMGFLSRATTYSYHVGLTSLKVGINGDYTVSSSEQLYSNHAMQFKLLAAYEERSKGKKTLIFNNGINTSKYVCHTFIEAGYKIKHLDNTNSLQERREILDWFRNTPDAILTSVSLLTTGFDEPTVETIILNRATKSLTLYFQMIGRGSRVLPNKSSFTVIDLGNNLSRFGLWEAEMDWAGVFRAPEFHLASLMSDEQIEQDYKYVMPEDLRKKFSYSASIDFDIKSEHTLALNKGLRPKAVIERSIEQHARICVENSTDLDGAIALAGLLNEEIEYRVRLYSYRLSKSSQSYVKWMQENYKQSLRSSLIRSFITPDDSEQNKDSDGD